MKIQGIPGVNSLAELERHVLARGCYDATENARIYNKWFSQSRPRDRVFEYVDRIHGITQSTLCDVGCGYGQNLVYAAPGLYGLELEDYQTKFARSIGLDVRTTNIITNEMADLPLVDTVWCAAVLEHVDAPHVFLRRLYYLLKPGGRLVLQVPAAAPALWLRRIPGMQAVYGDHDDHINSFSPASLARFCERAGFQEESVFRYSTPLINRISAMPVWATRLPPLNLVAQSILYVGRQVPNWDYPTKATRRAANNRAGYLFRSMFSAADEPGSEERH